MRIKTWKEGSNEAVVMLSEEEIKLFSEGLDYIEVGNTSLEYKITKS